MKWTFSFLIIFFACSFNENKYPAMDADFCDSSVLAIQGPPGSGKTYIGASLILHLRKAGKKIGITAVSHKVIRNLAGYYQTEP